MRHLLASGYCLAVTVLGGCAGAKTKEPVVSTTGDGKTVSEPGTVAAKRGASLVRFVNAVPERTLDLTTDDHATFLGVEFKTVTPYTEIGDNLVKFRVLPSGAQEVLADNNETMGDGYRYTIVAMPTDDGKVGIRVLRDELLADSGKARMRVIQATPGLSDVDVAVSGQKDLLFDNVKYGTEAGFKDVSPATASLEFRVGEAPNVSIPVRVKSMHLDAGRAYTLVLAGTAPKAVQVITFNDMVRK